MYHSVSVRFAGGTLLAGGTCVVLGHFDAATAVIDYLPGPGQPGNSVSGVGAGILYRAPSDKFKFTVNYGYGFNAIRDGERGANSLSFLLQIDLDKPHGDGFKSAQPDNWRVWNWLLGQ